MYRFFVLIALLVLAVGLSAQTGFFGLSYGDSYQKAKSTLSKGDLTFVEKEHEDGEYYFACVEVSEIHHLVLYFDEAKLVSWKVFFEGYYDDDIYDYAMQTATELHDEGLWDDELYCYRWVFDTNKSLFIGYNYDEWLVAEYYNEEYSQYTDYNW
jgi:hypothetical protein